MSNTLKQVRENMAVHTVFVIYHKGKPLNAHGRIAYEREQDAKAMITSLVNGEARRKSGSWDKRSTSHKEAAAEIRKEYSIEPYRASSGDGEYDGDRP